MLKVHPYKLTSRQSIHPAQGPENIVKVALKAIIYPWKKFNLNEFFFRPYFHYISSGIFTAKIAFKFTSLSAVHIYDFHMFTVIYSLLHGFVKNLHTYIHLLNTSPSGAFQWTNWITELKYIHYNTNYISLNKIWSV